MLTWGRLSDEQQRAEPKKLLEYWKYTEAYIRSPLDTPNVTRAEADEENIMDGAFALRTQPNPSQRQLLALAAGATRSRWR